MLYLRTPAFATQGAIMATSVWPDFKHRNPKDPLEPIRGHHGGRVETAGCGSSLFICAAQTVYAAARSTDIPLVLTENFISQRKPRRQFRDCLCWRSGERQAKGSSTQTTLRTFLVPCVLLLMPRALCTVSGRNSQNADQHDLRIGVQS